jgi:hypothetical protein
MRWLAVALVLLAGCGGQKSSREPPSTGPRSIAAPDAGMPAGHGAEPARVRVPDVDRSAPEATLRVEQAWASSAAAAPDPVRLSEPVLHAIAVGRDKQGMGRIRVSLQARIRCAGTTAPLVRYFPPPAIERVRVAPGTVVATQLTRRVRFPLRCPHGPAAAAEGTLWADATSAWETEASSAPLRFSYRR